MMSYFKSDIPRPPCFLHNRRYNFIVTDSELCDKIAIIMAGILAAAAAMTGCAEQNKTETQVDYTQNSQEKSEQTKQKTAEKSQPDKKQVNKSTSIGKEDSNQTADKKTKISASSNNAGDVQNSENGTDSTAGTDTDDSQTTGVCLFDRHQFPVPRCPLPQAL